MKRGKDGSVAAGVEPCLVPKANQLASVDDVFNAVPVSYTHLDVYKSQRLYRANCWYINFLRRFRQWRQGSGGFAPGR